MADFIDDDDVQLIAEALTAAGISHTDPLGEVRTEKLRTILVALVKTKVLDELGQTGKAPLADKEASMALSNALSQAGIEYSVTTNHDTTDVYSFGGPTLKMVKGQTIVNLSMEMSKTQTQITSFVNLLRQFVPNGS